MNFDKKYNFKSVIFQLSSYGENYFYYTDQNLPLT